MSKAMNHKMEKQEYKNEYAKRSSVEGPFWNIQRTIPNRKRSSHWNDKNRRKNQLRHISIYFNQIIQFIVANQTFIIDG